MWNPISLGPYTLEDAGLKVEGDPTLSDADAVGRWLSGMERRSQRYLGLWYLDIKSRFPERYSQLLDTAMYEEDTLAEYARVVTRVLDWEPELGFTKHQAVAALPRSDQKRILEKAKDERMTLAEVRQEARRATRKTVTSGEADGVYRVVYVNPTYDKKTVEDLIAFPMSAHLAMNSAVFLWMEERYRDEAPAICEAWGVRHAASVIWDMQENLGPTAYLSTNHQYLLWLVRGKCPPDNMVPLADSVVSCKASVKGERPEVFRQMIDRWYDHGRKLEIYAPREVQAEGWSFMGEVA